MNLLKKLLVWFWGGLVGAVAGASIGLVAVLMLLMTGFSLDIALWAVAILAMLGAIVGFVFGNKTIGSK